MRFTDIRLQNFKCYADTDLPLSAGVTVIHGRNGSGKSSLLEACFFALYGAKALDRDLPDIVSIGAEEAIVELSFVHEGDDYLLRRRVRMTDERARTAECVLEAPDETVSGARDVRGYVTELLRMDADAFRNCAYVRQGEVNKLINADAGERQDMIDELLQLGKLEEYRERAVQARRAVDSVLDDQEGRVEELDEQIAQKESKELHERLNALETELSDVDSDIERHESNKEEAEATLEAASERIEAAAEQRERLEELGAEIQELETEIRETEAKRDELSAARSEQLDAVERARERAEELADSVSLDDPDRESVAACVAELETEAEALRGDIEDERVRVQKREGEAQSAAESAGERRERAEQRREEAAELEDEAEALEDEAETAAERAAELEDEVETLRERFADAPVEPGEAAAFVEEAREALSEARAAVSDVREELAPVRSRIEDAEQLKSEGKCPECGQPVEGSPHVDALAERREKREELEAELDAAREEEAKEEKRVERAEALRDAENELREAESERERLEQRREERAAEAESKREAAADAREAAAELETEIKEKETAAEEAAARAEKGRARIGALNRRNAAVRERLDALERLDDALETAAEAESEAKNLAEKDELLAENNDARRERLSERREEKRELEDEFDAERIEEAKEEKQRASDYLERVESELETLREKRDSLIGKIERMRGEIEELEERRERRAAVAERVAAVRSLRGEADDLETMYGDLRSELRQQNVETLETMLNETFALVYENDTYTRIEVDERYELTVYQQDGEPLEPTQLSGGERAVFNLSLRCAIYRLLAEGIDGAAPMPPLVLDEPTVFLDSGHVSRLVELVDAMRSLGVEQILVVSHDEELVSAADELVRVSKDPTSNRSVAEREPVPTGTASPESPESAE
mgnify:CR=1 FL=1